AASVSVIDTVSEKIMTNISFFDPTPPEIKLGRRHFYDTRRNSGLGQAACASCHVDGRFDRLAWDLGIPSGTYITNDMFTFAPLFHPMKGPMVTQTLQDIIGLEPLHWRGDRRGIEDFNATFVDLLARDTPLTDAEMGELKVFLATIHFPPNPLRSFDNSFSTNVPLPGHFGVGAGGKIAHDVSLPNGDARAGLQLFCCGPLAHCTPCHAPQSGRGPPSNDFDPLPRVNGLSFKVAQLRSLPDKVGMDTAGTSSRAGFGFLHDGRVDSLTRFLVDGFGITDNQQIADLTACLLSFSGSGLDRGLVDIPNESKDAPAAIGKQITLRAPNAPRLLYDMVELADNSQQYADAF